MKTIIEPFKIKMVEPIRMTTKEERKKIIEDAGFNLFNVKSQDIIIDLLTDSGTASMSTEQWAGIIKGDEAYAGSKSYYNFENTIKEITGLKNVIPTHQGRAAERLLFSTILKKGQMVLNNSHFDTTRANIEYQGGIAVDLVKKEFKKPDFEHPFKGNMDTTLLDDMLRKYGSEKIPLVMLTLTNNTNGGQPVSMQNIREVREICDKYGVPLFFDACRFAENAYFIKTREKGYADKSLFEIANEMFSYADGCTMSAKKDGIANIGGFIALNDSELAQKIRNLLILTEGFPTYGGLAGRDLEAIAIGLKEALNEDYMRYRIKSTAYLGEHIEELGIPVFKPTGGHAVYVVADKFLTHIPRKYLPGQALSIALYIEGGIRSVEIGTVMFGKKDEKGNFIFPDYDLVRLAIPRRVYTQSHIDYVIEVFESLAKHKNEIPGFKFNYEAPILKHFTSTFTPVTNFD